MSDKIPPLTKKDGETKDLVEENIDKLKQLFPEIVTDGKIDFETLKEVLGEYKEDSPERYSFTWNGKSKARKLAMTPSRGTLRPAPEESVNWDNTENLFIEGDNLEVLKLLQRGYHSKIKMIYIDPPYNTGNDFVYPDDYSDNIQNYMELTGQVDGDGRKVSSNPEYSGRYHTDWLNMMFPRLLLAKELLTEDGMLYISIDDHEVENLKKICGEVFGEDNFVAHITWQRAYSPVNLKKTFSESHDFILCYAKNKSLVDIVGLKRSDEADARYSNPDNDPRGDWKSSDLSVGPAIPEKIYKITLPSGRQVLPSEGRCWVVTKDRFKELKKDNRIWFGKEGDAVPSIKRFLSEVKNRVTPMTFWTREEVGDSQEATRELKKLFDGRAFMEYPKPLRLMDRLIEVSTLKNDLILDFFAGSATTAHSVLKNNAEDFYARRFIMVQLPEKFDKKSEAYKEGYKTIADLGRDRISRAIGKIKNDFPNYNGDLGYKTYHLDSSNIKPWDPHFDEVQLSLEDSIENIKSDRSEQDVLYEILLKYGLELSLPIEERNIAGAKVFVAGAGALLICLSRNIDLQVIEGIAELKIELAPELTRVVFRDSGFKDDVVKTNAVQILKQHGIEDVRSI